jgi:1-acyl-sn-glycerol-3-phosphate acyltransferase
VTGTGGAGIVGTQKGSIVRGAVTITLMALNVVFWCMPLFVIAFVKLIIPLDGWRRLTSRWLVTLAECWIGTNKSIFALTGALDIDLRGQGEFRRDDWYLVVSNHRSWVDILVLQTLFNRRVPFLKFFLKRQLIWVPLLGLAWWALDMPFMRRYSAAILERHPELRGKDLEATRRACERFRRIPTSIMNFVEGTRFTDAKRVSLGSPYAHLLPPRAGGIAFVLSAMGGMLHSLLDVTIAYRDRSPSLWDLCCGRLDRVVVHVRQRAIEDWMSAGDYLTDGEFRRRFQTWVAGLWHEKDILLAGLAS